MPASTVMPDVVVEIAFATGPSDPAPTWVDVSQYVEAHTAIPISRGRPDELNAVQPSRFSVTLDNRDGRFTPGNVSSPYYPNVKKGRRIRVRAMWPLATSYADRVSGYVDEWPVVWPDGTSAMSTVTVTASSRLGRFSRGSELRSIIEEVYLEDNPVAYYPFGDAVGTTRAGNVSAFPQPPMTVVAVGSGGSITFGSSTGPGTDGMTAALFSRTDANNGSYMRALPAGDLVAINDTNLMIECFFNTSTADTNLVHLNSDSRSSVLSVSSTGKLQAYGSAFGTVFFVIVSTATVTNGLTHHAALRQTKSGATITSDLFLDGALVATDTSGLDWWPLTRLYAGGYQPLFNGTLSHVAVYNTAVSDARILEHANAGLNGFSGESSNARIVRLARYADVPAGEVSVETGLSTSITNQITNDKTALSLMSEVVDTEGGVLFDARNGNLTFHARSHRYNAAVVMTLSATNQEIEGDLEPKLDDQGLLNDMTASRDGGVSVRAVDTASIADYGLYRESVTLLTTSDNEIADAANWKVQTRSTPAIRIAGISVDLLNCSSAQKTALLALEIGDRITLTGLPSQAPASSMDFFIEGYTETIGAESYRMTFNLSPASLSGVWQLDSSTYSVLGTSTRLAY